jgi:hypothetical protein
MSTLTTATSPTFLGHPTQFVNTTLASSALPLQATYQPQTISIVNQQPATTLTSAAASTFVPSFHYQQGTSAGVNFLHAVQHHVSKSAPLLLIAADVGGRQ